MNKLLIVCFLLFSCTPAPRYKAGHLKTSKKSKSGKKVKFIPVTKAPTLAEFDTSKKVYKGMASYYGKDFFKR